MSEPETAHARGADDRREDGDRPGEVGAHCFSAGGGYRDGYCEHLDLHFTFDEFDWGPSYNDEKAKEVKREVRSEKTYKRKLVIAPAPAPANASWGIESGWDRGWAYVHRIKLCSSLYDKKRVAFSAIAPTIGAGRPCPIYIFIV